MLSTAPGQMLLHTKQNTKGMGTNGFHQTQICTYASSATAVAQIMTPACNTPGRLKHMYASRHRASFAYDIHHTRHYNSYPKHQASPHSPEPVLFSAAASTPTTGNKYQQCMGTTHFPPTNRSSLPHQGRRASQTGPSSRQTS